MYEALVNEENAKGYCDASLTTKMVSYVAIRALF